MWPATSTRCTTARKDKTIWDLSLLQCSSGPSSKKHISSFRGCSCNILGKNKSLSLSATARTEWQTSSWSHPLSLDTTSGRHFSHFLVRCLTTIVRLVRHLQWAWLVQKAEQFHNACLKQQNRPWSGAPACSPWWTESHSVQNRLQTKRWRSRAQALTN